MITKTKSAVSVSHGYLLRMSTMDVGDTVSGVTCNIGKDIYLMLQKEIFVLHIFFSKLYISCFYFEPVYDE